MNFSKIPLVVWFLIPTILIIGVGVWFFSKNSGNMQEGTDLSLVPVSNPVAGTEEFQVVSRTHIASGTSGSGYNSNPPTSGDHWPAPAKNGVYDSELPDEQLIHNLEHGHIWISYRKEVGDETVAKLKEIVADDDWKIVMTPREKNDSKIALAAWGRLLKMDEPDYDKIKDFIRTYRNRGPEKTPD